MTDHALIVAANNQRIRLRVIRRRHDALYFAKVCKVLGEHPEIKSVRTNAISSSILILYEKDLEQIMDFAADKKLFRFKRINMNPMIGETIWRKGQQLDIAIATLTRGKANTENLFFMLFLGLGLYQLRRGQIMQPAIPLLWRAISLLRQIHENGSATSTD